MRGVVRGEEPLLTLPLGGRTATGQLDPRALGEGLERVGFSEWNGQRPL
jgi:hypothetical protein